MKFWRIGRAGCGHHERLGCGMRVRGPEQLQDDVVATLTNGITHLRDRTILFRLMEGGLRPGELIQLDRGMIFPGPPSNHAELGSITTDYEGD